MDPADIYLLKLLEAQKEQFKEHLLRLKANAEASLDERTALLIAELDGVETKLKEAIERLEEKKRVLKEKVEQVEKRPTQTIIPIKPAEREAIRKAETETISNPEIYEGTSELASLVQGMDEEGPMEFAKKIAPELDDAIGLLDKFGRALSYYDVGILTHFERTLEDIEHLAKTAEHLNSPELKNIKTKIAQLRNLTIQYKNKEKEALKKSPSRPETLLHLMERLSEGLQLVELFEHTSTWKKMRLPKLNKMVLIIQEIADHLKIYKIKHSIDFKILKDNMILNSESVKLVIKQGLIILTELEEALQKTNETVHSL